VVNNGGYFETFNVTLYYDSSIIGQQTLSNLESGGKSNLLYVWDTSAVESNRLYSIRAEASAVPGETILNNNVFVYTSVKVRSFALESVKIAQLVPSNYMGNPASSFDKGSIAYFKVEVNSTSDDSEVVLVTVNVFDSSSASLGVAFIKGVILPGISVFVLGLPISTVARSGTAQVYANTFTDWPPPLGTGIPYGQEKSASFQILG
jgi:hypothetical protein